VQARSCGGAVKMAAQKMGIKGETLKSFSF
jgi:hypothetical protein